MINVHYYYYYNWWWCGVSFGFRRTERPEATYDSFCKTCVLKSEHWLIADHVDWCRIVCTCPIVWDKSHACVIETYVGYCFLDSKSQYYARNVRCGHVLHLALKNVDGCLSSLHPARHTIRKLRIQSRSSCSRHANSHSYLTSGKTRHWCTAPRA